MAERTVKVNFLAVKRRRIADPPWPNGQLPLDWLLNGAPKVLDPSTGNLIAPSTKARSGEA